MSNPENINSRGTPDQRIAHEARNWRVSEKAAIGSPVPGARDKLYKALQKLRETVDNDLKARP